MLRLTLLCPLLLAGANCLGEDSELTLDTVEISGQQEPLTEISVEKLLKVPGSGNDPLAAIGSLPGVTFSVGRTSEPAVRGSSPDDNQYLIDFIPVGYIFHSDSSSILSDNVIEDFRLETAAWSPVYNNATGAVIEATSRAPYQDRSQLIIDASLLKAGLFYEQPVNENQSFYLAARQSLFQYYIENFLDDEDFKFTTVPEYYDYQGKYEVRVSDNEQVWLQINGSRDKAGLKFSDDSDQVQQDPGLSGNIGFEAFFNTQGVVWQKLYDSGFSHKIGLSHMEQKFAFNIGADNRVDVKVDDFNLRSQFVQPLSYSHELGFGVELNESHIAYSGELTAPACDEFRPDCRIIDGTEAVAGSGKPVVREYDAHLQDTWLVTPDWTLTPGVALAWDDYTEEHFTEPRLQSRWQFSEQWWFTQAYGQHHIFPDNFGQYVAPFGNTGLKQPTADHYELGLEHQPAEDLLWKIEIYYKDLDNIAVSRPSYDLYSSLTVEEYNALPRYTNDGEGRAYGAEFFINKNLSKRWYGWLSVAWSRTLRHNNLTGDDFSYNTDQPLIINTVANYKLSEGLQLGVRWRYQSGQLITPLEGAVQDSGDPALYNPVYGSVNSARLPAWHRLDVRLDRKIPSIGGWDMDLYAEVLNLYNRANVTGYEYTGADYSGREEVTDLPLILSFGIKAAY